MGQPIMAFLQQEFGFRRDRSALAFGMMLLPLALCVALLNSKTFNDEFDYWAGTVMLVVFALGEIILFAWVFGMERGWAELTRGAEIWVPRPFYLITKYVSPVLLALILVAYVFKPAPDWGPYLREVQASLREGRPLPAWQWAGDGMIGKLLHTDIAPQRDKALNDNALARERVLSDETLSPTDKEEALRKLEREREKIEAFWNRLPAWRNVDRLVMLGVYGFFCLLVYAAWSRRMASGRL
jgi:hypothetical protein